MAHGAPDWHKLSDVDILAQSVGDVHINIAGQDMSEIINRPTYGECDIAGYDTTIAASTTTDIVSIAGTGVLYGGYIHASGALSHQYDTPYIKIDSNYIQAYSFKSLYNRGMTMPALNPFRLSIFDDTNYIYRIDISPGLTFESSVLLRYGNYPADIVNIYARLFYATI